MSLSPADKGHDITDRKDMRQLASEYPSAAPGALACMVVHGGFLCTRPKDHDGIHVAHMTPEFVVYVWRGK